MVCGKLQVQAVWCAGLVLLASGNVVWGEENRSETNGTPATRPASQPATQPAVTTRPAPDEPIIRIGDVAAVTQNDFDFELRGQSPKNPVTALAMTSNALINRKLIELYVKEHPGFITPDEIDEVVNEYMTKNGVKSIEEFEKRLAETGYTLDYFRWRKMEELASKKFNIEGTKLSEDEDLLQKMWKENRAEWDGRRAVARHILLAIPSFATPEQRKEIRDKATQIRDDLVSGKRTWEQCVTESTCRTRTSGGRLGSFRRHLELNYGDELAEAAFALKQDEISQVVETIWGFHILQVTGLTPGGYTYDQAKRFMKFWLRIQPKAEALKKMRDKYPIVGVQWPAPPLPFERPKRVEKKPTTRPATRPATTRRARPTTRPAFRPPATRPAASRPVASRPSTIRNP